MGALHARSPVTPRKKDKGAYAQRGLVLDGWRLLGGRQLRCFAGKQLVPNQSLRQTHREWHITEPEETKELLAA